MNMDTATEKTRPGDKGKNKLEKVKHQGEGMLYFWQNQKRKCKGKGMQKI